MLTAAIHQVFWFITAGGVLQFQPRPSTRLGSRPSQGDPLTPESIRWEQCNTRHLQQGHGFCDALSYAGMADSG